MSGAKGTVFNVQHFSTDDGPGIRTTVFLKGCPLRCLWCANPESQAYEPQLAHRDATCIACKACISVCPRGALSQQGSEIVIDRSSCTTCGACVMACPSGAMFLYGEERSAKDVFEEVLRDKTYYETSGGGVTASGGECMGQPAFVAELFGLCKDAGICTALDTCGFISRDALDMVRDQTDLVLFDIKAIDGQLHEQGTSVSNRRILNNFDSMLELGMNVVVRVPVIPGWNDSNKELGAIADFVVARDPSLHVDVLPYHKYGIGKYELLGMPYRLEGAEPVGKEERERYARVFESRGLDVSVRE